MRWIWRWRGTPVDACEVILSSLLCCPLELLFSALLLSLTRFVIVVVNVEAIVHALHTFVGEVCLVLRRSFEFGKNGVGDLCY